MYDTTIAGSFNLKEGNLQTENKVSTILQSIRSYLRELGNNKAIIDDQKNRKDLKLFTRPTIPWRLECELVDGYDRQYGIEQFNLSLNQYEQGTEELRKASVGAYVVIGLWVLGTAWHMGYLVKYKMEDWVICSAICQVCNRLIIAVIAIIVLVRLSNIREASRANIKALEEHVAVDCSDQWSIMNTEDVML